MPGYLLDTNILSDLVHHPRSGRAVRQLALVRAHGGQDISTSIIAAAELRYGVTKRGSTRLARQVETVLGALDVLPFEGAGRRNLWPAACRSRTARSADGRQ